MERRAACISVHVVLQIRFVSHRTETAGALLVSEIGRPYLLLQQALDQRGFASPDIVQGGSRLQCLYPDGQTETEGEGGAEDDEPALCAEPASVCGQKEGRQ